VKNRNQDEICSPSSHAGSGVNEKVHAKEGAGGPAVGGAPGEMKMIRWKSKENKSIMR
jgi:hypothetical protein